MVRFTSEGCIKEVILPDTIETIGYGAFFAFYELQKVTIPRTVKSIGDSAFYGCRKLERVVLPEVKRIGSNSFTNCTALVHIDLGNVESIGRGSFMNCTKLIEVTIPESLEVIEDNVFRGCYGIKTLKIPKKFKDVRIERWFQLYETDTIPDFNTIVY